MDRREIEEAALKLPEQDRAELLKQLVLSLEAPNATDEECDEKNAEVLQPCQRGSRW